MPAAAVTIPRMLADLVSGERRFTVEAGTVDAALAAVADRHPELRVHLFDESGALRPHVSCFHNGSRADRTERLADGDSIVILQAVSGGAPFPGSQRQIDRSMTRTSGESIAGTSGSPS